MFCNKTVLITGGTGSFGTALIKYLLKTDVQEIRVLSRDEKKQHDMRVSLDSSKIRFYIGDVRDYSSILPAFRGSNFVFHAAALKQVPSCEFYPSEAVKSNIIGSENAIDCAIEACVEKFVLLSTDKAVYPINTMGLSKAIAEKILLSKARLYPDASTILCATRYGNVMGSRGSVIPLFWSQLQNNRPLTLTDPTMTRFLMSLDQSVELVLYAFQNAQPGDIFVHKAPSSTILDLANALIHISGKPSEINIIGTRHGEKLYETLVSREEMIRAIDHGQFFQIMPDTRDLNYSPFFTEGQPDLSSSPDYNSHNADLLSVSDIVNLIQPLNVLS